MRKISVAVFLVMAGGFFACAGPAFGQAVDVTPPTVPAGVSATITQSGQVYVSWNTSTDNVAVEGYYLYRNGMLIANTPGYTYYTDTVPAGLYAYTVEAYDAAGNVSAQSAPSSLISVIADTTPPTAPANLTAAVSSSSIVLSWGASTDNVAVVGYYIFKNGTRIFTPNAITATIYTDSGLKPGVTYSYSVVAYDAAGNDSTPAAISATTIFDISPPSVPTGLSATKITTNEIDLSWSTSTDNTGVGGYQIYRNGAQIASVASTSASYADKGVSPSTNYYYTVNAYDVVGNVSSMSMQLTVVTPAPDTTAPSAPISFYATPRSASQISLMWSPSYDNVGVAGYRLTRNGTQILDTTSTSYMDTGLVTSTMYEYVVVAYDAAGNVSAPQSVAAATLATNPVIAPPTTTAVAATPTTTPTNVLTTASSFVFTTLLSYGMRSNAVIALQNVLIQEGDLATGYATGFFGVLTQAAVRKFQCDQGIVCSGNPSTTGWGLVGVRTRKALNTL